MWSQAYKYYQIRSDKNLSKKLDTDVIKSVIENLEYFESDGFLIYKNSDNYPWMKITLIFTEDRHYSIGKETKYSQINLIEVITSKITLANENWYLKILKSIATKFGWEIILEEDDNGNENVLIR